MAGEERRGEQVEGDARAWRGEVICAVAVSGASRAQRSSGSGGPRRASPARRGPGCEAAGRGEEARSHARDPGLCWGLRAQSSPAPPGGAPWLCSHLRVSLPPAGAPARSTRPLRVGKRMRVLSCYLLQKDQILSILQIAALPSSQPRTPHPAGAALQAPSL